LPLTLAVKGHGVITFSTKDKIITASADNRIIALTTIDGVVLRTPD
jgi:hypothetical protein